MDHTKKKICSAGVLALLLCTSLLLFSGLSIAKIRSQQLEQTQQYLLETAAQTQQVVRQQIEADFQILHTDALMWDEVDLSRQEDILHLLHQQNQLNTFFQMGFFDMTGHGQIVDLDGSSYVRIDFSDKPYMKTALSGQASLSNTHMAELSGGWVNCYAVPLIRDSHQVGVLVGINDAQKFSDIMDAAVLNSEGFAHLVASDGSLVIRSNHPNSFAGLLNILDAEFDPPSTAADLRENLASGNSGTLHGVAGGIERIGGYAPLGINDWYVFTMMPVDSANRPLEEVVRYAVFTILSLMAVVLFFSFYIYLMTRRTNTQLNRLAYLDPLTGLSNKSDFIRRAQPLLEKRIDGLALVTFNIVRFRAVNDAIGFTKGDMLLTHIAQVLRRSMGENEFCFRDNNDRFGTLLTFEDREALQRRIQALMDEITAFVFPDGQSVFFVMCAGIKVVGDYTREVDIERFLDHSYMALSRVRDSHENRCVFFGDDLYELDKRRSQIENQMYSALKNREFVAAYQPKISLSTGAVIGAEALCRWNSPILGPLSPDQFIPAFEENGFIGEVDRYMLRQVCEMLRDRLESGKPIFPVSVNQSRLLFYEENYIDRLLEIVDAYAVPHEAVVLEVTETIAMEDLTLLQKVLERVRTLGFRISMDDFGSGYSSLNLLENIPIDELKIDRLFMAQMEEKKVSEQIVQLIISLAKSLSITTVSEGVETQGQAAFLRRIGCDAAQGYLYAKPMPLEQLELFLTERGIAQEPFEKTDI